MELFFLLSIGMSIVALLPIALNEPQLFPNQQNQITREAILLAGVETTFPTESYLRSSDTTTDLLVASVIDFEAEGTQRPSKTVIIPSESGQRLKSAV